MINNQIQLQDINYKLEEIFDDYGFKAIVNKIRDKTVINGLAKNKSNSIIKEPFLDFNENKVFYTIV